MTCALPKPVLLLFWFQTGLLRTFFDILSMSSWTISWNLKFFIPGVAKNLTIAIRHTWDLQIQISHPPDYSPNPKCSLRGFVHWLHFDRFWGFHVNHL